MYELNKVIEVYKLNDGKYLVKIDLDCCEDNEDSLVMSYKDKMSKEEDDQMEVDDLFISASTEKDVADLIIKYLPKIINKTEDEVIQSYEEMFKNCKVK